MCIGFLIIAGNISATKGIANGLENILGTCKSGSANKQKHGDYTGKAEPETAALPYLALYTKLANVELLGCFLVFANDSLAIHDSETEPFILLMLAQLGRVINFTLVKHLHIVFRKSHTGIGDGNLNIISRRNGTDADVTTRWGEFSGIVAKGVDHEERECHVCLHLIFSGIHRKCNALLGEKHTATGNDVKELLKRECGNMQLELTLTHLDPIGQHVIQAHDFARQFADVSQSFLVCFTIPLHSVDFGNDSVKIGNDGIDK